MRAIVLSGGGAQGAYQVGVWKALKKLKIKYDIVTGTSVGALNGLLMTQNSYYRAYRIWMKLDYGKVFNKNMTKQSKDEIIKKYFQGIMDGGIPADALSELIDRSINIKKIYQTNIQYGLVTTELPKFKPLYLTKDQMKPEEIKDYLMASSALIPVFKKQTINQKELIDGGFYDNLPINFAIDLGATEIIAINLGSIGRIHKPRNKKIPITYIEPNNNLGSIISFEHGLMHRSFNLGYNDTMKVFNKLEGKYFTFRNKELDSNFAKYHQQYIKNLKLLIGDNKLTNGIVQRLIKKYQHVENFNELVENIGNTLSINDEKIYTKIIYNRLIMKIIKSLNQKSKDNKNNTDNFDKLKSLLKKEELIAFAYQKLLKKDVKFINNLTIFLPNYLSMAIYIKTINKK